NLKPSPRHTQISGTLELLGLRSGPAGAGALAGLLGEEHGVDVGQDAAGGDGDAAEQPAELLVVADGELDVARRDPGLLVVARRVAGQLQGLGGEVLEDGAEVDGGARAHALRVAADLEVPGDAADGELQARLHRPRHRLAALRLAPPAAGCRCRHRWSREEGWCRGGRRRDGRSR
uniref:Uncharacterized protein n=1 Tax=Aegilops tauschii subsp. strangulata TaxID=200361 RepID=A0A453Q4N0_AEGTS